jgi:hypothetical protein
MKTKLIPLLLIILLISGCNPCKKLARKCPPVIRDSISYIETVKEDPNYTIPDTAFWNLMFECDSNYNVLLHRLDEANTGMQTETVIKTVYKEDKSGKKMLQVQIKSMTDSILTMNKTIEKLKNNVRTIEVPKEVIKYKSRKMFVYSFVILIVLIVAGIGYVFLKFKSKIIGLMK